MAPKAKAAKQGAGQAGTTVTYKTFTLERGQMRVYLLGTSPFIHNRLSEKTMRQLLLPPGKKNGRDRLGTLKHDPMAEFRAAPYRLRDANAPTWLALKCSALKRATMTVALDIPGAHKAEVGRHLWVEGELASMYGIPQFFMSPVRSADMKRTPDIRTRCIVPEWACELTVNFAKPNLAWQPVMDLMGAAGMIIGMGDWRQEKGSGRYGNWDMVDASDPRFQRLVAEGGREAQLAAMENPEMYDEETADLFEWYETEVLRRSMKDIKGTDKETAA